MRTALTLAGFDPSGGAGVLADLKVFEALGLWGLALPTAMTAQNSVGVQAVAPVDKGFLNQQMQSLQVDFQIAGVKLGMLLNEELVAWSAQQLTGFSGPKVLDPVLVSSSGHLLLREEALGLFKARLMPLVDLITPNLAEAAKLTGLEIQGPREMVAAAHKLLAMGPRAVLVKGGHLNGAPLDLYLGPEGEEWLEGTRIEGKDPHGTGCLLSAALLSYRLRGLAWPEAARKAKAYAAQAIAGARAVGSGKEYWSAPRGH
ncbi:MAG: bifunctional hydroxymethylpyrimidine kinase/phosphomethylpyrimidine kinase [bacterium]|nr:bifunctional hydroxymethylpyrimidine kinase/phosphomethylpyrimidine kinase [bacterium]